MIARSGDTHPAVGRTREPDPGRAAWIGTMITIQWRPVRLAGLLLAVLLTGLGAVTAPAQAATAPAASQKAVKVHAEPEKSQVHKGEVAHIRGHLETQGARTVGARGDQETLYVQQFQAGAWVDVASGGCRPDGDFLLSVTFSVSATVQLRVYHPETDLYLAGYSDAFALVVI